MGQNIVQEKSYQFALRIVRLYQHLADTKHEFVMSRKVLNVGTDIGARIKSAQESEFKAGFIQEMHIALQKTSETEYWLQLLRDGEYLDEKKIQAINDDCLEIKKLLTAILKTSKGQQ